MTDMKIFVLTISRYFPKTHKRAGDPTFFVESFARISKIHTIRANYELWKNRIDQVNEGIAVLSLRYWIGKPYNSKQKEFWRLDKDSGIGVQKLEHPDNFVFASIEGKNIDWEVVAKNDGLSFDDFCEWFNSRQKEPMAIIHFTKKRY